MAGTEPTSVWCLQHVSNPAVFQCLVIYSSGIPNFDFHINFSFSKDGHVGSKQVPIDPFANAMASRSLF